MEALKLTASQIPAILNYGLIGLSFLLAYLAYALLRNISSEAKLSRSLTGLIAGFMGMSTILAGLTTTLEISRNKKAMGSDTWGSTWGSDAEFAFRSGGVAEELTGNWEAVWKEFNENGDAVPYSFPDPNTGQMIEYPPEQMLIAGRGAMVSCKTTYATGENIDYWYEGRISSGNHITLIYWTPNEGPGSKLVGTVFLEYITELNKSPQLIGTWTGRTRDREITKGTTVWTKQ